MPSERTLRGAAAVAALIGAGVATYIAVAEAGGDTPACLVGGGGCETVANSSYSELFGVNVAVIGIVGYVLLFGAALTPGDPGRFSGLLLALGGFGFSAYLTYLELFMIDAICQWCVTSAVVMAVLLALNLIRAIGYTGAEIGARTTAEPTAGG